MEYNLQFINPTNSEIGFTPPPHNFSMKNTWLGEGIVTVDTWTIVGGKWVHILEVSRPDRVEFYTNGVCVTIGMRQ